MARHGTSIDAMAWGIQADARNRGSYLQNLLRDGDSLAVRKGYGQLSQYDSTLSAQQMYKSTFLGAFAVRTSFGHNQILSVSAGQYYTGDSTSNIASGEWTNGVIVRIYDVTTDQWHEEPLVGHTGDVEWVSLSQAKATWQITSVNAVNNSRWITSVENIPCWFAQYHGSVLFGNSEIGTWVYHPAAFGEAHRRQLHDTDDIKRNRWSRGDTVLVHKVLPTIGFGADKELGYQYLSNTEWPVVVTATSFDERMVYGTADGYLWFSDQGRPSAIANLNFRKLPVDSTIKTIGVVADNIVVGTDRGMYTYIPSTGFLVSGGRWVTISDTVSANAMVMTDGGLCFADDNGVYQTSDGISSIPLHAGIQSFYQNKTGISVPLTHYLENLGFDSLLNAQPEMQYVHKNDPLMHLAYDSVHGILHLCYPEQGMSLARDMGTEGWILQSYKSGGDTGDVVATNLFDKPYLLTIDGDMYLIGQERDNVVGYSRNQAGVLISENGITDSIIICKYGHGGAVDRSIGYQREDRRVFRHRYRKIISGNDAATIWLDKWIPIPKGTVIGTMTVSDDKWYWMPIWYSHQAIGNVPTAMDIQFKFDTSNWEIPYSVGSNLMNQFPTERLADAASWNAYTWDGANPAFTSWVRIEYTAGVYQPTVYQRDPIMLIPFHHKTNDDVMGMGIVPVSASITLLESGDIIPNVFVWEQGEVQSQVNHATIQPVEWMYMTPVLSVDKDTQIRGRGLTLTMTSSDSASTRYSDYNLLNVAAASDNRMWTMQELDVDNGVAYDLSLDTTEDRFPTSTGQTSKIYGGSCLWADVADPTKGNYLIDDWQTDQIAISTSAKGDSIQYLMFGYISNPAEYVQIADVQAVVQQRGKTRRTGR